MPDEKSYEPDPQLLKLFDGKSGNTVNGRGEPQLRRPSPFFWHPPDKHPLGKLSMTVGQRFAADPRVGAAFYSAGKDGRRGPDPIPQAASPVRKSPQEWTEAVKTFALAHEADLVGIVATSPLYVYEGYEIADPWVVILGVAHDYERLSQVPSRPPDHVEGTLDAAEQYHRGARAAHHLRNFILSQGYHAKAFPGPAADALSMMPAAIDAGLGQLGKHGSLINRRFGSAFRLAGVTTDLPLVADAPDEFGSEDFCTQCQVCTDHCPPQAISDEKQLVRGVSKWYVDFDKCIPYFADTLGCGICIAVCPYSRPGIAGRLVEKMLRRRARKTAEDAQP